MENILTNSIKFYQKWEIKNICLIILIISLYAERTIKGFCCVNEGYVKNLTIRRMFYFENIKTKFFCMTWCCYMLHLIIINLHTQKVKHLILFLQYILLVALISSQESKINH